MREHVVRAQPLTSEGFAPFGQVVGQDEIVLELRGEETFHLDVLSYDHKPLEFTVLNRHHNATQALVALNGKPTVVLVGPGDLDFRDEAHLDHLQAFLCDGSAGINLVIYPNLFIMGNGTFAVFEPVAVDLTNIRYHATLINDAPDQINQLPLRFEEDLHSLGSRDDSEIQELVQHTLAVIPEMEWLDVSRGLCRQTVDEKTGVITSNKTDDTAIRGGYDWWRTLMNRDVRTTVLV